jgi:hypothetical protein
MKSKLVAGIAALVAAGPLAADHIDVGVAPAMREYCHIVRFPQGWKVPIELGKSANEPGLIFHYEYSDDYEFRVPGLQGAKFLVAGLIQLPEPRYTTNKYEVDLPDPKAPVLSASVQAWQSATPIALKQEEVPTLSDPLQNQPISFNRFQLTKSGKAWAIYNSRVSPDKAWVVLQSWTGSADLGSESSFGTCFPFGCRGKIFLDVFNGTTGKKVLTIEGRYAGSSPDSLLSKTGWLTEGYFIVPLGEHRERCLVCEFGARRQTGAKP